MQHFLIQFVLHVFDNKQHVSTFVEWIIMMAAGRNSPQAETV